LYLYACRAKPHVLIDQTIARARQFHRLKSGALDANRNAFGGGRLSRLVVVVERHERIELGEVARKATVREVVRRHGETRHLAHDPLVDTWCALLALLALTTASAYIDLGPGNTVLNLVIAATKAVLIAVFFMQLVRSDGAVRVAAVAALFFLFILAFLSFSDILSRPERPAPWHEPARETAGTDPGLAY